MSTKLLFKHFKQSINSFVNPDEAVNYLQEFLDCLNSSGTSPYNLLIKKNAPIILLRNKDPQEFIIASDYK